MATGQDFQQMCESHIIHAKKSIPSAYATSIRSTVKNLLHYKFIQTEAWSQNNLLCNMEINMIFDVTPCSSFIDRDSTPICANCMFNLTEDEPMQQEGPLEAATI